jgi:uncharacterized lipoprotein YddW (UPF0748 family)
MTLAAVVVVLTVAAGCGRQRPAPVTDTMPDFRGLWITRWDYLTRQDVERSLDEAARLGVTDVFFQVRGQADAFYRSELEPWGHQLGGDPGYDPLAVAVTRAHKRGLRLHAWINVYPLWKGVEPPSDAGHPWRRHPDWLLHDAQGAPQELNEYYVVADPTNPAAADHIAAVARDICTRYDVDGLHLDYVRFVGELLDGGQWPADAAALARWREAGGRGAIDTEDDRQAHRAWVRDCITGLVARMAADCRAARPGLEMSAAVLRNPEIARETYLQDGAAWVRDGHLDRVLPMIYTADAAAFAADLSAWRDAVPADRLAPGIGVYKHAAGDLAPQLRLCDDTAGWSLFAYSSLLESANPEQDRSGEARELRRDLRRELSLP